MIRFRVILLIIHLIFLLTMFVGFWLVLAIVPSPHPGIMISVVFSVVSLIPNLCYTMDELDLT